MTENEQFDAVPEGTSVIVVSDLHLGLEDQENVSRDFAGFFTYLGKLRKKGAPGEHQTISIEGKPRELYAPDKIILLGDIVDLWSPKKDTYSSVAEDGYPLLATLMTFPEKIVYVAGNHDQEIAEFTGSFPTGLPTRLKIIQDHYPDNHTCSGKDTQYTGLQIGNNRYFFLHGQQFDMMFNTAGVLQDYPGWVAKNYMLFREHPILKWGTRAICGFSLVYLVAAALGTVTSSCVEQFGILFGITFVISLFTIEPASFRGLWDAVNMRIKTKTATIETIIEEGFWKPEAGKNLLAEVVVFGHTHVADDSKGRYLDQYQKRFINSGNWGPTKTATSDNDECEINTFVYIDAEGPLLFYWPSGGHEPVYISRTLTGDPKRKFARTLTLLDRFRRWRRRVFWTGA